MVHQLLYYEFLMYYFKREHEVEHNERKGKLLKLR